jgi:hypothetical protein
MAEMDEWSNVELSLYQEAFDSTEDAFNDRTFQFLYDQSLFEWDHYTHDERVATQEAMKDYLFDNYGIDFDAVFDWEAYRANYG